MKEKTGKSDRFFLRLLRVPPLSNVFQFIPRRNVETSSMTYIDGSDRIGFDLYGRTGHEGIPVTK